jgi:hypothetical protein
MASVPFHTAALRDPPGHARAAPSRNPLREANPSDNNRQSNKRKPMRSQEDVRLELPVFGAAPVTRVFNPCETVLPMGTG